MKNNIFIHIIITLNSTSKCISPLLVDHISEPDEEMITERVSE